MTIYTAPNITSGIDDALIGVVREVPSFTPMLLIFIFSVVLIGGMISQKKRMGSADMPMWATMASIATLLTAFPLTLAEGLIDLTTFLIVIAITIASGLWLFLDKNRNEV